MCAFRRAPRRCGGDRAVASHPRGRPARRVDRPARPARDRGRAARSGRARVPPRATTPERGTTVIDVLGAEPPRERKGSVQTVGNILWLIFVGIWLAIAFVVAGIVM